MREIKFRGKRLDNRAWETGSLVIKRMGMSDEEYYIADKMTGHLIPVDPETVGQFAGLFDKNGKEIYEGDVFTVLDKYPKVVRFIPDRACFCVANTDDVNEKYIDAWQSPGYRWWNVFSRAIKIIGNEHDNPELLKAE